MLPSDEGMKVDNPYNHLEYFSRSRQHENFGILHIAKNIILKLLIHGT